MVNEHDWCSIEYEPMVEQAIWLKDVDGKVTKGWFGTYINHSLADHKLYYLTECGGLAAFTDKPKTAWASRIATKTAAEVEKKFRAQLDELLTQWGAELEAKDHWTGYSELGSDIKMTVSIPAIYRDCECLREDTEIDLGTYQQGKTK